MKKHSDLITVISFCLIIACLSVGFVVLPDRDFSQQENRALAQAPEFNKDDLFSGKFANDATVYFADQFPLRDLFVKIKSGTEMAFMKKENNGVLYGDNNQLAVKNFNSYKSILEITENTDRIFPETIDAQLENVDALGNKLNIPLVTVIPPRTIDIADSAFDYDRPDGDAVFDSMNENLSEKSGYIDVLSLLRPKYEQGEYVYYKTDHHWTTLGAYYTYCEIMKSLEKEDKIIPQEEFDIEQISDFSGTTAARANFPYYEPDILEIWHLDDENDYEITADGEVPEGLYNRSFLSVSDKYSVFLDGTHNVTTIKKQGEERETLLVAKDSFANCLIPFLVREFDIVALNLHTVTAISAAAEGYEADAVLIVYNTENLITTGDLGKIK